MNREIKFRAWDGEKMTDKICIAGNGNKTTWNQSHFLYIDLDKVDWPVMQFTGLYENCNEEPKLNNEIYEGDLVLFLNGSILAVEWNDDTCQWQFSDGSGINSGERYGCYRRVIGNIYENPELLTKNQSK